MRACTLVSPCPTCSSSACHCLLVSASHLSLVDTLPDRGPCSSPTPPPADDEAGVPVAAAVGVLEALCGGREPPGEGVREALSCCCANSLRRSLTEIPIEAGVDASESCGSAGSAASPAAPASSRGPPSSLGVCGAVPSSSSSSRSAWTSTAGGGGRSSEAASETLPSSKSSSSVYTSVAMLSVAISDGVPSEAGPLVGPDGGPGR
mmetsp:Transcript_24839/g.69239  ORF Transcript_24839/g.69239 Transcript_24839/m.69239 type:complete len:206 (+) Transcript_24839:1640-2257(+)